MPHVTRESLMTLEAYSRTRNSFRKQVLDHKKQRKLAIGEHLTLLFEDELTVRYQIQEMLRIEKIFEDVGIQDELAAYNPLVPDGRNFKATMLIEYDDPLVRRQALGQLKGVERKVWIQIEGAAKVYAIADEDLERENDEKTSAVHFLRFELTEDMAAAMKYGVSMSAGCDHVAYPFSASPVPADLRNALVKDLA
jgi:Protein of unknown function (DUF3501)